MNTESSSTSAPKARTVVVSVCVRHDDQAENPREDQTNLGVFAGWHRRYKIGDVQPKEEPGEWLKENAPSGSVVLGVGMYDHSGVSYYSWEHGAESVKHDQWDGGQVGWIVATPEKIREWFQCKRITKKIRERTVACLKAEIETYEQWATGDTWYFTVEGPGYDTSVGGFYGDALEDMKAHVAEALHKGLEDAWEERYDSDGEIEVEVPMLAEQSAEADREERAVQRAKDVLDAHGLDLNDAQVPTDAKVRRIEGGAWVTVELFVPNEEH